MSAVLLLDAGNQRLKWACLSCSDLGSVSVTGFSGLSKVSTFRSGISDLYENGSELSSLAALKQAIQDNEEQAGLILVSSVAGSEVREHIEQICRQTWRCSPEFIAPDRSVLDFSNHYDNPTQLGSDRWLAACAARQLVDELSEESAAPESVIVIDAGTAVTVDLMVGHDFQGGAILPGYGTTIQALGSKTGQIRIDADQLVKQTGMAPRSICKDTLVATNSGDAVKAGAIASVAGGVKYMVQQLQTVLDSPAAVCVSGGDGQLAASGLDCSCYFFDNIVLTGLAMEASAKLR